MKTTIDYCEHSLTADKYLFCEECDLVVFKNKHEDCPVHTGSGDAYSNACVTGAILHKVLCKKENKNKLAYGYCYVWGKLVKLVD